MEIHSLPPITPLFRHSGLVAFRNAASWMGATITAAIPEHVKSALTPYWNTFVTTPLLTRTATYAVPVIGAMVTVAAFEAIRFSYHEYKIVQFKPEKKASDQFATKQMKNMKKQVVIEYDAIKDNYDKLANKKLANENLYNQSVTSKAECAFTAAGIALSAAATAFATGVAVTTVLPACLIGSATAFTATLGIRLTKKAIYAYRIYSLNQQIKEMEQTYGCLMAFQQQQLQSNEEICKLKSELGRLNTESEQLQLQIAELEIQLETEKMKNASAEKSTTPEEFFDALETVSQPEASATDNMVEAGDDENLLAEPEEDEYDDDSYMTMY